MASTLGFEVGNGIAVSGCSISGYNTSQTITAVVANTSITTDLDSSALANPADGTITADQELSPISTALETGWLALGSEWAYKLAHSVSLAAESVGVTFTAQVSLRDESNNEVIKTAIMALGDDSIAVENDWLIWDVGKWSNITGTVGQNWAGDGRGMYAGHKRYTKGGKGLLCRFGLYAADSQDARIVQIKEYFRLLRKAI